MFSASLVEFLGTTLLIGSVAFGGSPLLIIAALSVAIALGGKISGGHFNPAITIYQLFVGKISNVRAMYYVGAQLAAAVLVGMLYKL